MKNNKIEKITKDWDRKQRYLLRHTDTDTKEKIVNLKRSKRYGHTYDNKKLSKYGLQSFCYQNYSEDLYIA